METHDGDEAARCAGRASDLDLQGASRDYGTFRSHSVAAWHDSALGATAWSPDCRRVSHLRSWEERSPYRRVSVFPVCVL